MHRSTEIFLLEISASSLSRKIVELFNSTHKLKVIQIHQREVLLGGQK